MSPATCQPGSCWRPGDAGGGAGGRQGGGRGVAATLSAGHFFQVGEAVGLGGRGISLVVLLGRQATEHPEKIVLEGDDMLP